MGVPRRVERGVVGEHKAEGAHQRGQQVQRRLLQRSRVRRQQRRHQVGVRGHPAHVADVRDVPGAGRQRRGVREVAVVPQAHAAAVAPGSERGLRVLPGDSAGRGVAGVAHGEVPRQARQRRLVEDGGDEAQLLVDQRPVPVADRHPRRLLAAVLQRVQAEVRQAGDVLARRPHPEDAALLVGDVVQGAPAGASGTLDGTSGTPGGTTGTAVGGVVDLRRRHGRRG